MNTVILERRRERVRNLITLAQEDGNTVGIFKGYYLLNLINKRLSDCYSLEGRFSNLF